MKTSDTPDLGSYAVIREVPFVASTTGSWGLLNVLGRRQQERLREQVRAQLHVMPLEAVSFGRAGRTRIEPTAVLACMRLSSLAPPSAARFCRSLAEQGVLGYMQSKQYGPATQQLLGQVQAHLSTAPTELPLAGRVNWLLARFAGEEPQLIDWAEDQQTRWARFGRDDPFFERLPGRLVRIEGDEALVSLWNDSAEREELRTLAATDLLEIGVETSGDPLVIYDMTYIPGVRISTVVPGVQSDRATAAAAEEEARLRRFETPLPSVEQLRVEAASAAPLASDRTVQSSVG